MNRFRILPLGILVAALAGCSALPLGLNQALGTLLPETDPYVPPSFDSPPPGTTDGNWERFNQALPAVLPTPAPTPKSLPEEGYSGLFFAFPDGLTGGVGGTVRVTYTPEDKQTPVTLGVLDSSRARFDADGRLTFLAPGPVFAYGEQDGKRTYFLAVGLPTPPLPSALQAGITMPSFEGPEWATFLQSRQDWDTFEQRIQQRGPSLNPSPSPPPMPAVDFSKQVILALNTGIGSDGEKTPVLTQLDTGASPSIQLVFPNENHQVGFGEEYAIAPLYVIPKPSALPTRIQTIHLNPNAYDSIPVLPPSGPSPSPSPTPMPSPSVTTSPGMTPPYPPPTLPPAGSDAVCPPRAAWSGQPLPIDLNWTSPSFAGSNAVLRVGQQLHLSAASSLGPVTWQVVPPSAGRIDAFGTLTAEAPGPILVNASAGGQTAQALVACLASPDPALYFHFNSDVEVPASPAPRVATIIRDRPTWMKFWSTTFLRPPSGGVPEVDFTRYNVVALVDARTTLQEGQPVLTNVVRNGTLVQIVFPGLDHSNGIDSHIATDLFLTGPLKPNAQVQVTTLCHPTGEIGTAQ